MTCNRLCAAISVFFIGFFTIFSAQAGNVPLNKGAGLLLQSSIGAAPAFIGPQPAPDAPNQTALELKSANLPPTLALSVSDLPPVAQDGEKKANLVQRLVNAGSEMTQQSLQSAQTLEKTVEGWEQKGIASWYGPGFHGRKTASGERFDTGDLTAAHLSLPFGTKRNGKEVVVRVNDRGPYIKSRIIDLSQAAAKALGIDGIGRVVIQRLESEGKDRKRYRSAD